MKRGRVVGFAAAGVAVAVVAGTLLFGGPGRPLLDAVGISPLLENRSDFSASLDVVPKETDRLSFTDWAAVRDAVGADLGSDSSPAAIEDMIAKAYDTDLSASSSIETSAVALQRYFGFSPATIDWEAYAQTQAGAAMVVHLPDDIDYGDLRDNLGRIGFTAPSSKEGVWEGGVDLIAALDGTLTPKLQYVALLEDEHLVVTSESVEYTQHAVDVARGKKDALGEVDSAREVVDSLDEPATAELWTRDFACTDLAMSSSSPEDQAEAKALIDQAGKVSPLSGLVMSMAKDRTFTVSELFESDEQAEANLEARAKLIVGPSPGNGSFAENLTLTSSTTDGKTVRLVLKPKAPTGFVLGAFNQNAVLFATC